MERGYARAEARNEAIRSGLEPLAPDERPTALKIATATCVVLAVANLVLLAVGYEVRDQETSPVGAIGFAAILGVAAWGMWTKRYWAVLGFQALLAMSVIIAALSVLVASNAAALVLCLAIIVLGGWLFWKLIRVLSRMQVPRPGAGRP